MTSTQLHLVRRLGEVIPSSRLITDPMRRLASSRTCEIGLSETAGFPYQSILYLVETCSRVATT